MSEPTGNHVTLGAAEPVESVSDVTCLVQTLEDVLDISQEVTSPVSREERQETQQDGQGQSVCPPEWAVGAACRAVWSEDGRWYPATVVCVDGLRCRVRFSGYGNEEDMDVSALQKPEQAPPPQRPDPQGWSCGSQCRAVYSEDGLVYPAKVLWVKGDRCRVRFDYYNNEEELDVCSLLRPEELLGPSRGGNKVRTRKSISPSSTSERRRREENQGGRGGERRSVWREDQQNVLRVKEKTSKDSKVDRDTEDSRGQQRDRAEKPTNHSFCLFPPFPPPVQFGSEAPPAFIPPPSPLCSLGAGSPGVDTTAAMLMLWYTCGFHTGSYMAQQQIKSTFKD